MAITQLYNRFSRRPCVGEGGEIDVSAACGKAMRLLAEGKRTREDVSTRAGISMQTVDLIAGAMSRRGATADAGWESLPDSVRFSAIKSECYPTPPRDAWIMVRLAAEGATTLGAAVSMPVDRAMLGLVKAGHVRRAGDRFYLDGIGPSLAQGVLLMYPELEMPAFSKFGGARLLARRLVKATRSMPPPRIAPAVGRRRESNAP